MYGDKRLGGLRVFVKLVRSMGLVKLLGWSWFGKVGGLGAVGLVSGFWWGQLRGNKEKDTDKLDSTPLLHFSSFGKKRETWERINKHENEEEKKEKKERNLERESHSNPQMQHSTQPQHNQPHNQ